VLASREEKGLDHVSEIGLGIAAVTHEPRSVAFLRQIFAVIVWLKHLEVSIAVTQTDVLSAGPQILVLSDVAFSAVATAGSDVAWRYDAAIGIRYTATSKVRHLPRERLVITLEQTPRIRFRCA